MYESGGYASVELLLSFNPIWAVTHISVKPTLVKNKLSTLKNWKSLQI